MRNPIYTTLVWILSLLLLIWCLVVGAMIMGTH
jgi:hypothetical protein